MKYNKIIKENDYNKNSFLITTISCIVLLLTLCYFGINSGVKGTYSADTWSYNTCAQKINQNYCAKGAPISGYCCPAAGFSYSGGQCVLYVSDTIEDGKTLCEKSYGGTYTESSRKCVAASYGAVKEGCPNGYPDIENVGGKKHCVKSGWNVISASSGFLCEEETSSVTPNTVKFDGNGGTASKSSISVYCGDTYGTLPTATRSGYTFNGWYTAASGGTLITSSSKFTYCGTQTLFAQWKIDPSYTITFNTHGGNAINSISGKKSEPIKLPTPNKNGCDFDAWYTSITNGTIAGNAGDTYIITGNATLHAVWTNCQKPSTPTPDPDPTPTPEPDPTPTPEPDPTPTPEPEPSKKTFTATFEPNGGSLNGSDTKSCSTTGGSCTISSLPTADRSGYTFNGWGTSKTCTSGNKSSVSLSSNTTFYACWLGTDGDNPDDDDNVDENPVTGQTTLMAVIWFLGLMAIGYAFYYFKSVREN